jgi:hypothetical protein
MVSKSGVATDGPFGETKEVIGGYGIIVVGSLSEAAEIAAQTSSLPHVCLRKVRGWRGKTVISCR